jgi:hypothetical protein
MTFKRQDVNPVWNGRERLHGGRGRTADELPIRIAAEKTPGPSSGAATLKVNGWRLPKLGLTYGSCGVAGSQEIEADKCHRASGSGRI